MILSSCSIVIIIALFYSSIVSILRLVIVSYNLIEISSFLLSIIFYCLSIFGEVSIKTNNKERIFKFIKSINKRCPKFFESINTISYIIFVINIIVHTSDGFYILDRFDQVPELSRYSVMIYIVLSTLPFSIICFLMGVCICIFVLYFILTLIIFVLSFIINFFLVCLESYREVYSDVKS